MLSQLLLLIRKFTPSNITTPPRPRELPASHMSVLELRLLLPWRNLLPHHVRPQRKRTQNSPHSRCDCERELEAGPEGMRKVAEERREVGQVPGTIYYSQREEQPLTRPGTESFCLRQPTKPHPNGTRPDGDSSTMPPRPPRHRH